MHSWFSSFRSCFRSIYDNWTVHYFIYFYFDKGSHKFDTAYHTSITSYHLLLVFSTTTLSPIIRIGCLAITIVLVFSVETFMLYLLPLLLKWNYKLSSLLAINIIYTQYIHSILCWCYLPKTKLLNGSSKSHSKCFIIIRNYCIS